MVRTTKGPKIENRINALDPTRSRHSRLGRGRVHAPDARVGHGNILRFHRIVPRELVIVVLVLRPDVVRLELGVLGLDVAVVVVVAVRVDGETGPPLGRVKPACVCSS